MVSPAFLLHKVSLLFISIWPIFYLFRLLSFLTYRNDFSMACFGSNLIRAGASNLDFTDFMIWFVIHANFG